MADEEIGEAELVLQILEQVDDLGLDGDVEGACGFVADDETWAEGEGAGDGDALALAARELVGVAVGGVGGHAAAVEEIAGSAAGFGASIDGFVDAEGFGDNVGDAHARAEACGGILEDDLHALAESAEGGAGGVEHVAPLEADGAGVGLDEAEDGSAEGGFAGA